MNVHLATALTLYETNDIDIQSLIGTHPPIEHGQILLKT